MIWQGMRGLGDNIYQRAFLRQMYGPLYLETPWPELYSDMPHVLPVRPQTTLRTQLKNMERTTGYHDAPAFRTGKRIEYRQDGIYNGMRKSFGVEPGALTLPDFGQPLILGRYAIVRPVTLRSEWRADTRNPLPEYVAECTAELQRRGVLVVSVADLQDGAEWPVGELPPADIRYHSGELDVVTLLALIRGAACVVGGIGWIVPAAIAAQVPAWVICGGQGGYNSPERITDPTMSLGKMRFAVPDNFCQCIHKEHGCDKRIADHGKQFAEWLDGYPALV